MSENKKEVKYNVKQYEILKRCSEKKDLSEWNQYRKDNVDIDIYLEGADFHNFYLEGADLSYSYLRNAYFMNANFKKAMLQFSYLESTNFTFCSFEGANLSYIFVGEYKEELYDIKFTIFDLAQFGDAIFSIHPICKQKEKNIITALSTAEVNNVRFIDPVFGRKVRDEAWLNHFIKSCKKGISKFYKKPLLWLWKITSNYGRNIGLWFLWSLIISLLFAIVYNNFYDPNSVHLAVSSIDPENSFWTFFYYSVVTFTTLGFGDITPISNVMKFIVMIEVVLGYIMLGGLISIFANKLARRND